jgi:F-type H+-transporting ATPase subunit b
VFIQKLRSLAPEQVQAWVADVAHAAHAVTVKSAFDLPDTVRQSLEKNVREMFGQELVCSFEVDPALVCGIELVGLSHKIGWNLSRYVASVREAL